MNIPKSFSCNLRSVLFRELCETIVKCAKRFQVEQHCQTAKHQRKMSSALGERTTKTQSFVPAGQKDFTLNVVKAFIKADIPLYKLRSTRKY